MQRGGGETAGDVSYSRFMKNLLSVTKIISHTSVGRRIKATHHHRIHYFIQWAVSLNDVCMVLQCYCHINLCFIKPQRLLQIQIHRSSINQDWSWRLYISVGNQPFYLQASFYYSNVFTVLIQLGTAASLLPLACHCRYKLYKLEIICHVYSKRQLRSWFPVRLCLCIRLILPQSSGL